MIRRDRRLARLRGATVVVTGATSGVGRGVALALGDLGARVVVSARREQALEELAVHLRERGGEALPVVADVSDPAAVERLAKDAVATFGAIDVWVNNAGVTALGAFWDTPIEDHRRVIDVTLGGTLIGSHAALQVFRAQGRGVLVNVGSLEGSVPLAYQSSYAAAKAAVDSLTRVLHQELRLEGSGRRIRVGSVLPWALDTPLWRHVANRLGRSPRMAWMEDPARAVDAVLAACVRPRRSRPVGAKALAGALSVRLAPRLTDRLASDLAENERRRGTPRHETDGSLRQPVADEPAVDGGTRARMRAEDAAPEPDHRPRGGNRT